MLTVKDVSVRFDVTNETVRRWIRSGKLNAVKTTNKGGFLIEEESLSALRKTKEDKHQEQNETIQKIKKEVYNTYKHLYEIERLLRSLDL